MYGPTQCAGENINYIGHYCLCHLFILTNGDIAFILHLFIHSSKFFENLLFSGYYRYKE